MKDSFIFYTKYQEVFEQLSDEDAGKLIKGILEYSKTGKCVLTGMLKIIFTPIKQDIDKNNEKYKAVCERNKTNGTKGGRPKADSLEENPKNPSGFSNNPKNPSGFSENPKKPKKPDNEYDNDYDNDNEYDNDNNISLSPKVDKDIYSVSASKNENKSDKKAKKDVKHKYGEYKNVLLKDAELESLKQKYDNWQELIKYLDEYIEMKGYSAKSHYLCIIRWVANAVEEEKQKKKRSTVKNTGDGWDYINSEVDKIKQERNEIWIDST